MKKVERRRVLRGRVKRVGRGKGRWMGLRVRVRLRGEGEVDDREENEG